MFYTQPRHQEDLYNETEWSLAIIKKTYLTIWKQAKKVYGNIYHKQNQQCNKWLGKKICNTHDL